MCCLGILNLSRSQLTHTVFFCVVQDSVTLRRERERDRGRRAGGLNEISVVKRWIEDSCAVAGQSTVANACRYPLTFQKKETLWANLVQHSRLSVGISSWSWSLVKSTLTCLLLYTLFTIIPFAISTYEDFCRLQKDSNASSKTHLLTFSRKMLIVIRNIPWENGFSLKWFLFRWGRHFNQWPG